MALTPVQENQLLELLNYFEELKALGADSSLIIQELGALDTVVPALPFASAVADSDVIYLAQADQDSKLTILQMKSLFASSSLNPESYYLAQI